MFAMLLVITSVNASSQGPTIIVYTLVPLRIFFPSLAFTNGIGTVETSIKTVEPTRTI